MENKIAQSGTIEGLTKLINEYFYSSTYYIENMQLYNSKGLFDKGTIKKVGKKYQFFL